MQTKSNEESLMKTFAPMLAYQKYPDLAALHYPLMGSPKLDGLRAMVRGGQLVSRTLKLIPNRYAQKLFSGLPEGTDGELIVGDPTDDPFRRTDSAMTREEGEPDVRYFVFDNFAAKGGYQQRYEVVKKLEGRERVVVVLHVVINTPQELADFEVKCLDMGFEGGMINSIDGPYKYGRSTLNEGYLLKLKRYEDSDAEVLGTYERMHNGNEATTDNLGRTARSSHKANKSGQDTLGGFFVRDVHTGVEFKVPSSAIKEKERKKLWLIRDSLVGKFLKYKFFPTGMKDRPRHPVFLAWRSKFDIS
jgi:DNA ligase-1